MRMSTETSEAVIWNLNEGRAAAPAESIVSRTLYGDEQVKAVLFTFAPGQELSEHTASTPAILHLLQGEAELTLGGQAQTAGPGTWVHMPARLPHALVARTEVTMLLLLLR
jgi:quercetin dioxygenase-like cupin family protein